MPRRSVQLQTETALAAATSQIHVNRSDDTRALSVSEFCGRNQIGKSSYFYLLAIGRAPRSTRVGRRVIIFPQDEAAWRRSIQENPLPASLRRAAEAAAQKEAA
jgi:predicted DNA-binding transcriptional regulator AlpA